MSNSDNSATNDEKLYSEWVPMGNILRILFLFVIILLIIPTIIVALFETSELLILLIIVIPIELFLIILFVNYRGIKINITKNLLEVEYGFVNHKKIILEEIINCEPTRANFGKYGGIGVRLGFDGSWAYNTSFGKAVKIESKYGRPFVFSTFNPEKICSILNNLIQK